jgi:large subunit ribosomal protein L16
MQQPKRVKFRKAQRGSMAGQANSGNTLTYGEYGLQALEAAWVTSAQLEAARRAITRHIRRGGQVWIRVFPDKPATKKPAETRMGSGKGLPDHWVAVIKAGRIMFEMSGVGEKVAREAIMLAAHKLPLKTHFIEKESAGASSSEEAE